MVPTVLHGSRGRIYVPPEEPYAPPQRFPLAPDENWSESEEHPNNEHNENDGGATQATTNVGRTSRRLNTCSLFVCDERVELRVTMRARKLKQ